jgi:hypothetical protein
MVISLISSWILIHFIIGFLVLVSRKIYLGFIGLSLLLYTIILIKKPVTYDLNFYLEYYSNPYPSYEPLLYKLVDLLTYFNNPNITHFVITVIGIFLYTFALRILGINLVQILFSLPLYIGGPFFILGTNNAVRQFLSAGVLIIALGLLKRRERIFKLLGVSLGISSSGFHYSGVLFLFVLLYILSFLKIKLVFLKNFKWFFFLLFNFLLVFIFANTLADMFTTYFSKELDWGEERMGNFPKIVFLTVYLIVSNYLLRKQILSETLHFIKTFRFYFFLFILPFGAMSGEAFPRLMFFFYAIDSLFITLILWDKPITIRKKMVIAFAYMIYGVMTNVLNILGLRS